MFMQACDKTSVSWPELKDSITQTMLHDLKNIVDQIEFRCQHMHKGHILFSFQKNLPGHKKVETVSVKNEMDLLKAYLMSSVFLLSFISCIVRKGEKTLSLGVQNIDSFQKPTVVKIPRSLLSSKKPFF